MSIYATLSRSDLRLQVQAQGLGGTWTASASKGDFLATLANGSRCREDGATIDSAGMPTGGCAPIVVEPATPATAESTLYAVKHAPGAGDLASTLASMIAAAAAEALPAAPPIDLSAVRALALDAAREYCEAAGLERPTEWVLPDLGKIGRVNGRTIKGFGEIADSLLVEKLALLVGPTGSGKTHAAQQLAEALGVPFYAVSCSGGMSESWIVGRTLASGTYVPTPFVVAWREGGLFLLDEFGACPDDVAIILNAALANGVLVIPSTGETVTRHERCYVVAADNSWGRSFSGDYSARGTRDLATANRFSTSQFFIGYDRILERKLARDILGSDRADEAAMLCDCMHALRKATEAASVERFAVSMRQIVNAARHLAAGKATLEKIVGRMLLPLADDEKERLLAEAGPEGQPWKASEPEPF